MTWYQADSDLPDMNEYDIIQGKRIGDEVFSFMFIKKSLA